MSVYDWDKTVVSRQQVANLEKRVESLSEEKENLLAQMERRDILVCTAVHNCQSVSLTIIQCI